MTPNPYRPSKEDRPSSFDGVLAFLLICEALVAVLGIIRTDLGVDGWRAVLSGSLQQGNVGSCLGDLILVSLVAINFFVVGRWSKK